MRTWNYRVLKHTDGSLALHEVYYDEAGVAVEYTANPVHFAVDGEEGLSSLIGTLERALRDVRERPILDVTTIKGKFA